VARVSSSLDVGCSEFHFVTFVLFRPCLVLYIFVNIVVYCNKLLVLSLGACGRSLIGGGPRTCA
jgi:hypothetical protein